MAGKRQRSEALLESVALTLCVMTFISERSSLVSMSYFAAISNKIIRYQRKILAYVNARDGAVQRLTSLAHAAVSRIIPGPCRA